MPADGRPAPAARACGQLHHAAASAIWAARRGSALVDHGLPELQRNGRSYLFLHVLRAGLTALSLVAVLNLFQQHYRSPKVFFNFT